jgi:hypothetical protein
MNSKTIAYDRQQLVKVEEEIQGILKSGAYIECQYLCGDKDQSDIFEKIGVSKVGLACLHPNGETKS